MKIGDYIRTKRGLIGKIININTFREPCMKYGIEASYLDDIWFIGDDNIKLVKEKPIDLIEKQDIIKYNPIQNHYVKKQILYKAIKDERDLLFLQHQVKNDKLKILEILTHEQFEENAYKVGE